VNALISFVILAAVVFFLIVKPVNHMLDRLGRTPNEDPVRECPECRWPPPAVPTARRRSPPSPPRTEPHRPSRVRSTHPTPGGVRPLRPRRGWCRG
jgi:large conductance mechanosensitive channel